MNVIDRLKNHITLKKQIRLNKHKEEYLKDYIFIRKNNYNFDKRIDILNDINNRISELNKRNDHELMKQGHHIKNIIDHYNKEQATLIIKILHYTNPMYEIIRSDMYDGKLSLIISTPLDSIDIISILNNIKVKDSDIKYDIKKLDSINRLIYYIDIYTGDIMKSLKLFIYALNTSIYTLITNNQEIIHSYSILYEYIKNFKNNPINESMVYDVILISNKDDIMEIYMYNNLFIRDLYDFLNYKIQRGDIYE